jgi:hypothetical protein
MRVSAIFVILAFVGCGGSEGSNNGSDGGTPSQCDDTATQLCQKAVACSTGHDGGVTVFLVDDHDGGVPSTDFTINGDVSHCDKFFMDITCRTGKAAAFTAACGPTISGLQCGTNPNWGNGLVLTVACSQNL